MQAINVDGTRALLDAAARGGERAPRRAHQLLRDLRAGPGPRRRPRQDEPPAFELAVPYKRTKLEGERLALRAAQRGTRRRRRQPDDARRPRRPAADAHRQDGRRRRAGPRPRLPAGGALNVVAVEDVARGHLRAHERGRAGERYLLGGENLPDARGVRDRRAPPPAAARPASAFPGASPTPPRASRTRALARRRARAALLVLDEVRLARHADDLRRREGAARARPPLPPGRRRRSPTLRARRWRTGLRAYPSPESTEEVLDDTFPDRRRLRGPMLFSAARRGRRFVVHLGAPGHHPKVGEPWRIKVSAQTRSGRDIHAAALYKFLYNGQVVSTQYPSPHSGPKGPERHRPYRFFGSFIDRLYFPERAVGIPLRSASSSAPGRWARSTSTTESVSVRQALPPRDARGERRRRARSAASIPAESSPLDDVSLDDRARRVRRAHRSVGLRQDLAALADRRPGPPDDRPRRGRRLHVSGEGDRARYHREVVGFVFQHHHLLAHLPAAANVEIPLIGAGVRAARAPRARAVAARGGRARAPRSTRWPRTSRAASASASPSPARWPTTRACCSPTSRPARWTRPRPQRVLDLLEDAASAAG